MSPTDVSPSFTARGGWWVALQVPVLIGAAVVPVVSGHGAWLPQPMLPWLGVALTALGIAVAVAGLVTLGDALTPFPRPRRDAALRTHGIYGYVRHPVYAGLILASLGWSLWWLSVWGGLYVALVFLFFDRKGKREERFLVDRYKDYPSYRARVRKFIPGVY